MQILTFPYVLYIFEKNFEKKRIEGIKTNKTVHFKTLRCGVNENYKHVSNKCVEVNHLLSVEFKCCSENRLTITEHYNCVCLERRHDMN